MLNEPIQFTRRAIVVSLVGLCAVAYGGRQGFAAPAWQDTVAAAEKEGSVVFYSSLVPATLEPLIAAFEKKYPNIKVQNVRNIEAVIIPKIEQEEAVGASGADLVSVNILDFYDDQAAKGQLVLPSGPEASKYTGENLHKGIAPIVSGFPMGFAYNSDAVKEVPHSYEDFLRPEYKGAVGAIIASASPAVTFWYDWLRKTVPGYWEKLAAQEPRLYPSTIPMSQAVASGEIKAAIFANPGGVRILADNGAPVKFALPNLPEVYGSIYPLGILKNAKHPNAAQVFADYLLSVDGQTFLNGNGMGISRISGVPGSLSGAKIFSYYAQGYTPDKIKDIAAEWDRTFRR
jgi:iron(III) transport system substrate-binding protein